MAKEIAVAEKSRKIESIKKMTATELYLMSLGISPRPLLIRDGKVARRSRTKIVA